MSGVPLDVAAHGRALIGIDGCAAEHSLQGGPQVLTIEDDVISRPAAVQLAAVAEGLQACFIG